MGSFASDQANISACSKEASFQLTDSSSLIAINQNPEQNQYYNSCQSEKSRIKAQQLKESADRLREEYKYELALAQYRNCLGIYEQLKTMNSVEVAAIFVYGIGDIYIQQGQFQAALEAFEAGKEIYQKEGDSCDTAASFQRIELLYYLISEYDLAIENYKKSPHYFVKDKWKDSNQVGSILNTIGLAYMDKSQDTLAMRIEAANNLHNTGVVYWNQGKYELALYNYQQALMIFQKNKGKDSVEVADTLVSIGVVLDDLEEFPRAIEMYKNSIAIYNKHRLWHRGYANAHENMGFTYESIKDYRSAARAYKISLPIYETMGQTALAKRSSLRLARCLSKIGKRDQLQQIIRQHGVARSDIFM